MIRIIVDTIRKYFRKCLEKNPHFALIADETSSQGRDVLSVLSSTAIQNSLQKHAIDITNCRGQAYDTNASMSSDKKGVQAEIARCAPVAKYQGCCLHSINLVICHACKIKSTQNMMDSSMNYSVSLITLQSDRNSYRSQLTPFPRRIRSTGQKICARRDGSRGTPRLKQFSNCMNTLPLR